MNKEMTAGDVVGHLRDGMTVGIGGWGARRKPMALVREIVRSKLRDLTVVSFGGPDVGMLCAAGKLRRLVFGFVTLDVVPLEPHFRKARESGVLEVNEFDEGMLVLGLRAAAMRVPFLPTRIGLGTDVLTHNPHLRTIRSPYDDAELLVAMPAIKLDVALLHANRADRRGNARVEGPDPYFDDLMARAAARCFVSAERVVDELVDSLADVARTSPYDRGCVTGVVEAPFGAHPTSCPEAYGWDAEHLRAYAATAGKENGWPSYLREWIGATEAQYLAHAGGADRIGRLPVAAL